jgi:HD-GYP domain-containing protein (c-di-GMP phosphodiesterase class II)
MSAEEKNQKRQSGETLIYDLFRILQVVKIHQSNNRLFSDIVASFKATLLGFWEEGRPVSLNLYRGRFYLNDERITYSPSMWATAVKMSAFFQERALGGLRLEPVEELSDGSVVAAVDAINKCLRSPDPFAWLQAELAETASWLVPTKAEEAKAGGQGEGGESLGHRLLLRAGGQNETRRQARQVYAQGLTVLRGLVGRLAEGKRAGVQKTKRVVEELIDLMGDDFRLYLALSTVRDQADQLFTHSLNVAILAMGLGRRIGLSKTALERLGLVALFHDLGKTTDFLAAAGKAATLDGHDLAVVRNHALGSVSRLIRLNASQALKFSMLRPVSEHHTGVAPSGRRRGQPPSLGGRIVAVADHYDAMTSWRPWRAEPMSPSMAMRAMAKTSGTDLDPHLVKLFLEMMGPWPVGSVLILDSKELALTEAPAPKEGPYPPAFLLIRNEIGTLDKGPQIKLGEQDPAKRRIMGSLSPVAYGLQAADYLL